MKLPVEEGDTIGKHKLLAEYGKSIYNSITPATLMPSGLPKDGHSATSTISGIRKASRQCSPKYLTTR